MENNYYPIEFDDVTGEIFTIVNNGTAPTPCVVTIIPKVDFLNLVIEGLSDEPLQFTGLKAKEILVIDGENNTVLVNDKPAFLRFNGWEFPRLNPGANEIKIANGTSASIQIAFNARYR